MIMFAETWAAFNTFVRPEEFWRWYSVRRDRSRVCEAWIEQHDRIPGYCDCCGAVVPLRIASGATFGDHPSLRKGLTCPRGLSGRGRLVFRVLKCIGDIVGEQMLDLILYEDLTALRNAVCTVSTIRSYCSLYHMAKITPGATILVNGCETTHQDITNSSYADAMADIVVHCDILEHIPNYRAALEDNLRILKPGGMLLFTAPFFVQQQETHVLAHLDAAGEVIHDIPRPEYHIDPIRGQILAYYRFGWSLLDDLRNVGFSDPRILVEFHIFSGLTSNNDPYMDVGNMPPLAIIAVK